MKRLLTLLSLLLAGCSLGLNPAQVAMPEKYIYAPEEPRSAELQSRWWLIFEDERLDSIVSYALEHNRDMQVAASRIVQAHYNIAATRSSLLPSLGINIQAEGQRTPPLSEQGEFLLGQGVSWNTALIGALRHTTRQARAEYLSTEWAYRALRLTLSHEVATAYFTLVESQQLLWLARRTLSLRLKAQSLTDSLTMYGFASGLDREQARSLVSEAEADVAQYERALSVAQLSLSTLMGTTPQLPPLDSLPMPSLPQAIPAGIPSELLSRRPDLMQAHYELQAAAAAVGIARSERFPSISLTESGGIFGRNVREVFTHGEWAWNITASLTQPLFSFGRLRRREQMAREAYRQRALQYEQSVLQALEDVEQALTAIATLRLQGEHYARYVEHNASIASLQEALYRRGMSNYLDVITTQQTWYASQQQFVQIAMQQYQAIANLVLALGDGWQE